MYHLDENDKVVELHTFAPICPGAPEPVVLAEDGNVVLSYRSEPEATKIAFVKFTGCQWHSFGPPNDETLASHPLYSRGVGYYGFYEVVASSLIREMERRNSHPRRDAKSASGLRHFILTFHDNTFECAACDVVTGPVMPNDRANTVNMMQFMVGLLRD